MLPPQHKLYLIGTPIGNREDITLRALRCLKELTVFFVEDTREFQKLLSLYEIPSEGKRVFSYADHNYKKVTEQALSWLMKSDIGLVCDRGTPGISDPGGRLVQAAREGSITLVPIPGPSSLSTLLSVSGVEPLNFFFVGFFPQRLKEQTALLKLIAQENLTLLFFESPQRIRDTAKLMASVLPDGTLLLGREMTKLHEEFKEVQLRSLNPDDLNERGEYAALLIPHSTPSAQGFEEELQLRSRTDKEWAKAMAEKYDIASSTIYNTLHQLRSKKL